MVSHYIFTDAARSNKALKLAEGGDIEKGLMKYIYGAGDRNGGRAKRMSQTN